jgi:hypothetical protein
MISIPLRPVGDRDPKDLNLGSVRLTMHVLKPCRVFGCSLHIDHRLSLRSLRSGKAGLTCFRGRAITAAPVGIVASQVAWFSLHQANPE